MQGKFELLYIQYLSVHVLERAVTGASGEGRAQLIEYSVGVTLPLNLPL